ncbi:uncharacterized protein PV06_00686 [Exophiala oligosperma]|uniref:VASt domain-containing protein n=1 Tax=Exophiala oligosperma TaxID=215243 RepID=A0A0D2EJG8_9EURO|nr:uncharacterized protein PV06_00686 [Exophiala oligosperma]KIW48059.1 hypothetical protein PV06_00686 [Exophiala oligosperma]
MSEPSPQLKGLKKVLSNRRRSSDIPTDENIRDLRTDSIDSLTIEKSPTRHSTRSVSQDGSSKSGSSGMRKLLPGHSKRKRRKVHEEEVKAVTEELARGRSTGSLGLQTPSDPSIRRSSSGLAAEGDTSLLTDDSEVETPPLFSRESHSGYLTMSSPLVSATTTRSEEQPPPLLDKIPTLVEPDQAERSGSPKSPNPENTPTSPTIGLVDRADTLRPESRRNSISKLRGKSPGRRFRDVFGKSGKSPKVSPERTLTESSATFTPYTSSPNILNHVTEEGGEVTKSPDEVIKPIQDRSMNHSMPNLDTNVRPLTPPTGLISTPVTTVTPPTPTQLQTEFGGITASPASTTGEADKQEASRIVVSHSGNMISHRRIRSTSSITHQPSKLSSSMTAPLTPTDENKASNGMRTPSGSLFSSWMSAAQNAASTISNLAGQTRARSGTDASGSSIKQKPIEEPIQEEDETAVPESPRKQLAVETMGSGDLNFEHLGLGVSERVGSSRQDLAELRKDSALERDEAVAKEEDLLAKRAVSAAYEKPSDSTTPMAEIADPIDGLRHHQTFSNQIGGERTPPNGSIFEGEPGNSMKRTNSVRSKLAKRRSRGSSTATGQSAIGAMIGASTAALANPAKTPRLTGFTIAPKQRNRNFHQQFRSVPEDDYLIEDYSCALQKEILVAGRIYISEGHICFSSNILGWVTTLVISFEEVVSIERESTAMVFPNAIAIQTLHARHTFRSLLYREQTYDLLIGIWRVSHPASFQKSMNGRQLAAEEASREAVSPPVNDVDAQASDDSSSNDSGSDATDDSAPSVVESNPSQAASEAADGKTVSRKPSGMNAGAVAQSASILAGTASDVPQPLATQAGLSEAGKDFPGPATHAPTDCTDSATHYDKVLKDEIIPAPLGKIYSLLYGPESGLFVRKFLVDECKCMDLVLEDDRKGLNCDIKSRQYTYIKPLGGSIGPKQTKCNTTENLDFFDLEKAVTITCTTQTPDVPSGNAFSVKTRYCLTWAPGNATRLQMNCTIEWTAKSWLKTPIEKGANDGQQQYGDALVKVLRNAVSGRPRGTTNASKVSKKGKKRREGKKSKDEVVEEEEKKKVEANWGLFEPLRAPLQPVLSVLGPVLKMEVLVGVLAVMVLLLWIRGPSRGGMQVNSYPYAGMTQSSKMAGYEALWAKEENEFWDWLEARASVDTALLREQATRHRQSPGGVGGDAREAAVKEKMKKRSKNRAVANDVEAKIKEEKISQREMEDAIRITRERLEVLEDVVEKKKMSRTAEKQRQGV